jgi:hypothetical protein
MDLARIRSLVIWAALSLALLSVAYAPKEFLAWSNESRAWIIPPSREFAIERERGYGPKYRILYGSRMRVHTNGMQESMSPENTSRTGRA